MKLQRVFVSHFVLTFLAVVGCFIWLAQTNAGNPSGRRGIIVTHTLPVYWIMIGFGQMFISVSIYMFLTKQPGYVLGKTVPVGSIGDSLIRLIPALIGSAILAAGVVSLVRK